MQHLPEYFDLTTISGFEAMCKVAASAIAGSAQDPSKLYRVLEAAGRFPRSQDEKVISALQPVIVSIKKDAIPLEELLKRLPCLRRPFVLLKAEIVESCLPLGRALGEGQTYALLQQMIVLGYTARVEAMLLHESDVPPSKEITELWGQLASCYLRGQDAEIQVFLDRYVPYISHDAATQETCMQHAIAYTQQLIESTRPVPAIKQNLEALVGFLNLKTSRNAGYLLLLFEQINCCTPSRKEISEYLRAKAKEIATLFFRSKMIATNQKVSVLYNLTFYDQHYDAAHRFDLLLDLFELFELVDTEKNEQLVEIEFYITEIGEYVGEKNAAIQFGTPSALLASEQLKKMACMRLINRLLDATPPSGSVPVQLVNILNTALNKKFIEKEEAVACATIFLRKWGKSCPQHILKRCCKTCIFCCIT